MNGFPEQIKSEIVPNVNPFYGTKRKLKRHDFYVYVYLDPRKQGNFIYGSYTFDHEPFYVGKGTKDRGFKLYKHINGFCSNKIKKIESLNLTPIIQIVKTVKSEIVVHEIEKKLIKLMGRQDLGTGILCNHTDGGEGCSGRKLSKETKLKIGRANKGRKYSEKSKIKMSKLKKGKKLSKEHKQKISFGNKGKNKNNQYFLGKKHSEETKLKISIAHKGKKLSEEHKKKLSLIHKGEKRKPCSEETKRKISEAHKIRYQNANNRTC